MNVTLYSEWHEGFERTWRTTLLWFFRRAFCEQTRKPNKIVTMKNVLIAFGTLTDILFDIKFVNIYMSPFRFTNKEKNHSPRLD